VAAIREGLLALREQIDDLVGKVDRLHQPRSGRSTRR